MNYYAAAATVALLALPHGAAACTADLECGPDGRCAKSSGAIYGTCVRDMLSPHGDRGPASPLQPSIAETRRCDFDEDCGPRASCMKTSEYSPGMCVKRR